MKKSILLLFATALVCSCRSNDARQGESKDAINGTPLTERTSPYKEFGERIKIAGDFNGDGIRDTLFESYISQLTGRETYRIMNTRDADLDKELIFKNKPLSRIYTNIKKTDTLVISDKGQQAGLYLLENIGDLDEDGADEFGYVINWTDDSNINRYYIGSMKNKRFVELLSFPINESITFEPGQLLDGKSIIQKHGFRKIRYKFYSDTATIETGEHTF